MLVYMQLIKKITYRKILYQVFRDSEGLLFVKFDNGHVSAATGRPMLKQLGKGSIKADGTFTGILTMKDKHGNYLSPHTRGSYVLRLLIDTEIAAGKEFKCFKSTWVAGRGVADNLHKFNEGLAQGMPAPAAALQTWTGQWLQKHYGFSKAGRIKGKYTTKEDVWGREHKHYTEITVVFER